ncbi:hypothetical protein MRY82_02780 [bacterium]|nr:hypothetical protein [bacterium]
MTLFASACGFEVRLDSFNQNIILPFNLSSCPDGWSDYNNAAGRVVLGVGSGNTDMDGNALTARTLGDTGGWEFTNSIPLDGSATSNTAANNYIGNVTGSDTIFNSSAISGYTDTVTDSNIAPYVVVKYYKKD